MREAPLNRGSALRAGGSQRVDQRCQSGAKMRVTWLETLPIGGREIVQTRAQVAEVTGFSSGPKCDIEKMQILSISTARRSFNNVHRRGNGGLAELALQSVALGRRKVRRCSINFDYQAISQSEHTELSMVATHGRLRANSSKSLPAAFCRKSGTHSQKPRAESLTA
jgi:hypothetical protein